jgi:hypothetical protein
MTTYFGIWKANTNLPPPSDPKVELQQNLAFQAGIRQDLESGVIKEAHTFLQGGSGYFISGDVTEEKLHESLAKWYPYVTFELHRTVPLTRTLENLVAVSRAKVAMLTVPA